MRIRVYESNTKLHANSGSLLERSCLLCKIFLIGAMPVGVQATCQSLGESLSFHQESSMSYHIRLSCSASLFAPFLLGAALTGCGGANSAAPGTGVAVTRALIGTSPAVPGNPNRSAVYGGGPFYSGGQAVMDDLRASGFNTVILWSIHVEADTGNLILNDKLVASGGSYVGDPDWPARLATLKQQPTGVTRIEVSIGSGGTDDFAHIRDLVAAQGTGPTSILYRNFQALKAATGADAANFDDESTYDLNSSTQLGNMLSGLGYKITFAPYTSQSYWSSLKNALAGKVDTIYLQAYDGGALNDPDRGRPRWA